MSTISTMLTQLLELFIMCATRKDATTFWTFLNLFVFSREISEGRQQPSNSLMYGRISKYSDFSLLKRNLRRTTKTLKDQTKYPHCFILLASQSDAHIMAPHRDPIPSHPSTYSSEPQFRHLNHNPDI